MCLTCGARARSVMTREAFRAWHGRVAKGRDESAMLDRGGVDKSGERQSPVDPADEQAERGRRLGCANEPWGVDASRRRGGEGRTLVGGSSWLAIRSIEC